MVTYPPPVYYSHPIQYILNGVQVCFPFVHPSSRRNESGFTGICVVIRVSIVNVVTGGLLGDRSLANTHRLDEWFGLQHIEAFEELRV
jgi:hypothetical protein